MATKPTEWTRPCLFFQQRRRTNCCKLFLWADVCIPACWSVPSVRQCCAFLRQGLLQPDQAHLSCARHPSGAFRTVTPGNWRCFVGYWRGSRRVGTWEKFDGSELFPLCSLGPLPLCLEAEQETARSHLLNDSHGPGNC